MKYLNIDYLKTFVEAKSSDFWLEIQLTTHFNTCSTFLIGNAWVFEVGNLFL